MSSKRKNYGDVDLYDLLGVSIDAEQLDIRQAYRKKALACHPDKNPDNPKAAELFLELSKALEILTDPKARAAYDKIQKAKKETELRNKKLNSERRKLKDALEQRELDAFRELHQKQSFSTVQKSNEQILQEEIERLRKEGSNLLQEERDLMNKRLGEELKGKQNLRQEKQDLRLAVKWKADKKDPNNGGYSKEKLHNYLKKYDDVVIVMSSKNGKAFVEFTIPEAAKMALTYEKGNLENPLEIKWVVPPENETRTKPQFSDFEDLAMRKARQAEERRRLIEEMKNDNS